MSGQCDWLKVKTKVCIPCGMSSTFLLRLSKYVKNRKQYTTSVMFAMVQVTILPIKWICACIKSEKIRLVLLSFSQTQEINNRMVLTYITWRMKPICNVGVHCDPFKRWWTILVLWLFILYCQHLPLLSKHKTSSNWIFLNNWQKEANTYSCVSL